MIKKAFILNITIAILVVFSVIWMFSGIKILNIDDPFEVSKWEMLKFYTVDSNIIMGISAAAAAVREHMVMKGRAESVGTACMVFKLIGTVGVTLTMLVASFFLAPTTENGFLTCFGNSNLFLHLIIPAISIFVFLKYEKSSEISGIHTITGISSMLIYASVYIVNCLAHAVGDDVSMKYDWYGFFMFGVKSIFIILPVILLATYLISFLLWRFNRK